MYIPLSIFSGHIIICSLRYKKTDAGWLRHDHFTKNGIGVMNTFTELIDKFFTLKQRKDRRFKVQDRVFVVFGPLLHKAKPIVDISMSGLSYLDGENQPTRSYGLNILAGDSLYFDDKISFIPVWKSEPADLPENSDKKNRCAVKFQSLTLTQKSKLKNFIRAHTTS
jgi:hypothetical protein